MAFGKSCIGAKVNTKLVPLSHVLKNGDQVEILTSKKQVPHDGEDYVHRIGRTARADADGTAITFISPAEQFRFSEIEKLIEKNVEKKTVPEELGATPEYNPVRESNPKKNFKKKGHSFKKQAPHKGHK